MRVYETTFILSPQADDTSFDRQIKSVTDLISKHDGKILFENRMGVRRLAYPINKFTQGFYTYLVFEGESKVLSELERFFRLEEPYIRYLTVLYERGPVEELSANVPGTSSSMNRGRPGSDRDQPYRGRRDDDRPARNQAKAVAEEPKKEKKAEPAASAPVEETPAVETPAVEEEKKDEQE